MRWQSQSLGEHVDILSGFAFKSEKFNTDNSGMPLVRIRDVIPGTTSTYYDGPYDDQLVIKEGDILIGMDGEFNCAKWRGGPSLLNQRVCRITGKNGGLDEGYLFRFLPDALKEIEDRTPFATVKHLSVKDIRTIRIPLPPLDEQRRIAAVLDQADDLRRKRREALALCDQFAKTLFNILMSDRLDNQEVGLGEVCQFISGNSLPVGMPFTGQADGCLLLKVSDLGAGANDPIVWQAKEWIGSPPRSHASLVAPAFSVAFPKRGGAIATNRKRRLGRAAVLDPNLMAVAVQKSEKLHPIYLSHWFEGLDLVSISSGSAVPQLNKRDLDRLTIKLPTFDAQRAFAARVAEIDMLKAHHRAHLAKLDALFVSLQHRAFRGEL